MIEVHRVDTQKLRSYTEDMNREIKRAIEIAGTQTKLAEASGLTQAAIHKLLSGKTRRISAENALAIERATDGQVTRYDLRPDIFGLKQSA